AALEVAPALAGDDKLIVKRYRPASQLQPRARIRPGHRLRKIDFPPQPVVDSQTGTDFPSVLAIEKHALLAFARVESRRIPRVSVGAVEKIKRTNQKITQREAGDGITEFKVPGRTGSAAQKVVLQISEVGPPANGVLPEEFRPVVDELELL